MLIPLESGASVLVIGEADCGKSTMVEGILQDVSSGYPTSTSMKADVSMNIIDLLRGNKSSGVTSGNFHLIYIYNFHVLSNLLLIYICKLHWNLNTMFVCQVNFI